MTCFNFPSTLVITRSVLDLTLPLTKLLQRPAIDADATYWIIEKTYLLRRQYSWYLSWKVLQRRCRTCLEGRYWEYKPRTSNLQWNRHNVPSESICDHFKKILTIPLLDHLTVEIERRFDYASFVSVYIGLVIIPSKMVSLVYKNVNWKEKFSLFADLFKDDCPCPGASEAELHLWEAYWLESKDCLPDNISSTLKCIPFNGCNNVQVSRIIHGTSPVPTCTYERSFSAMRRLKTYTRITMVSERLIDFTLMYVHLELVRDIKNVNDFFVY